MNPLWHKAIALAVVAGSTAAPGLAPPSSIGADGVGDPYFPQDGDPARPDSFAGDTTVRATAKQDLDRFRPRPGGLRRQLGDGERGAGA
ncbi:hypothetical protein [Amycolatopsis saalfeldensis]|uniref:Uncharacterized protein n=1 Tax=Amycolatopsis saalfeldensis TaxID=394193 RepID=A0A1H8YME4_9PSEU|nr:hypothetical protein [Amycolatopsis saalfeldensis]SEP53243.1 hypothetical protein SAMN04489732_12581 [Amycolatopsis saalfeldensis]